MENNVKFDGDRQVKKPKLIIFEKENVNNDYANFESRMKPRISLDDGISQEEYRILADRREEMTVQIEDIIFRNYLDEESEELLSEIDCFPDIRYFTGNYYIGYESYGFHYRDKNNRPYDIKNGQFRNVEYDLDGRKETYLPLDSDEITRYYSIFIEVRMTGNEYGDEEDYMGLDLIAELSSLDDEIDFDILSHNVI